MTTGFRAALKTLAATLLTALAAAPASALTLGVTEGVTYRATDKEITARFEAIATTLSAALKQPVTVRIMNRYAEAREALGKQEVDIAFIHPAHVALEATKGGKFSVAAWTKGFTDYTVNLLCKDNDPIADWSSVRAKKLVTPDPDSITAVIVRAMLREKGVPQDGPNVLTTRYQDAVPFYVENNFAAYGATASKSVIKAWNEKGGKVCARSRPVPIKQWVVSSSLDAATAALVRSTLVGLEESEAGRKALGNSGYKGFEAPKQDVEKTMMSWLAI